MVCYTCGEFIEDEDTTVVCPTCSIHYCHTCSQGLTSCHVCSTPTEDIGHMQKEVFNPAEIFAEVITKDLRKHPRTKIDIKCAFTFHQETRANRRANEHKVVTRDISRSGMCIYALTPLKAGEILNFEKCEALQGRRKAVIRWVKKANEYTYMAGLMFLPREKT